MRIFDVPRERAQLLVIGLGIAIVIALIPFASGLLGAAVLYVVFDPVHRWLSRVLPTHVAAGTTIVLATLLVLVPGALLVMILIDRTPETITTLQRSTVFARLASLRIADLEVGAYVARMSDDALAWLSRRMFVVFGSAVQATLNLFIALFGLYFMLVASPGSWPRVREFMPFSTANTEALRARFRSVTEAMLLGIALTAALQGSVVGAGFWAVGLPEPLFWGLITALVSILPVMGSALVWLPGMLVLLASGRYGAAVALLVIGGGIASNIDNVIRPVVYRRVSHIHPMTTIVGAFAGVAQFGLIGLLLGPLAVSYFFELVRIYHQEYALPDVPVGSIGPSEPGVIARIP